MKLENSDVAMIRRAYDFSLEELGGICGLSASTLSRIESGIMPVSDKTSRKICEQLDIDPMKLARIKLFFHDINR